MTTGLSDVAVRATYGSADATRVRLRFGGVPATAFLIALSVYLASHAGFALRLPQSGIGFVWPPNAILFAAFLLFPTSSWGVALVAALVGHIAAHTQDGIGLGAQLVSFVGNASQALLGAWMVRLYCGASAPPR